MDATGHEHDPTDEVLEHLGRVALALSEADTMQETLQRIVDLGQQLLARCDGVSLMLISKGGGIETPAYSSTLARDSARAQYATGEGPCLHAIGDRRTIVIDDLETDERWPAFRRKARRIGVRSMSSIRLYVTGDAMGALDLYSRQPQAFGRRTQLVAQVFSAHASVAVKAALTEAGLVTALRSRDVIGQAKGIVMARECMTEEMATDLLRRVSQDRNQKLHEVAAVIVDTGEIPAMSED